MRNKVVIVEGLIGAGKSSFTDELAEVLGTNTLALMEPDEEGGANPYLPSFYSDQRRWAFTMQVHLLQARFKMHLQAQWHVMNSQGDAVLDRSYFGDTAFARLQLSTGAMSEREFETYKSIYHGMTASVLLPNVCINLMVEPEVAATRIAKRMELRTGRRCESVIDLEYLKHLNREVNATVDTLSKQGVQVINVPWNEDRSLRADRLESISVIANRIREYESADYFLDLHRRTT